MLYNIVKNISDEFIKEATASPQLLSDMAAMEKYMSESYSGRIFVELLQNADDCGSKHILVKNIGNDLLFANDGHPFTEKDVIAISRSGASSKERGESIGYRGIGFKSTSYLTDEIIIHSDDTSFSFSKSLCSNRLNLPTSNIPMIRIPLLVQVSNALNNLFTEVKEKGYNTIFLFKNAKISEFIDEIKSVDNGYFLFLKNVVSCSFELPSFTAQITLNRNTVSNVQYINFANEKSFSWLIYSSNECSIGFKYDNKEKCIIECKDEEQLFHSYLPTYDKVTFPVKINADFSTDPSRKHITYDKNTENSLTQIANLIVSIIQTALNGELSVEYKKIFSLFLNVSFFSRSNSFLRQQLKDIILNKCTIRLNNGYTIRISEYKIFPNWLEPAEINLLRKKSFFIHNCSLADEIYDNYEAVDQFISQYSQCTVSNEDLITLMEDKCLVESMTAETQSKILSRIVRSERFSSQSESSKRLDDVKVLTEKGILSIKEISSTGVSVNETVSKSLQNDIGNEGIKWLEKKTNIKAKQITSQSAPIQKTIEEKIITVKPHISKWRSAEQQCIEIEASFGNKATDVSKKNIGYDIESVTPTGETRLIEVKSIKNSGEFSITNNEYTAAHQYGDNYYICLMIQDDKKVRAVYIQNPLKNLSFEKRIRQWEWVCDNYSGNTFEFDY